MSDTPLPKEGDKVLIEFEVDRIALVSGLSPKVRVQRGNVAFWMPPDWIVPRERMP